MAKQSRYLALAPILASVLLYSLAQGSPASDRARHTASAQRFYEAKEYDRAIRELESAYAIEPDALLQINIGRCHYLAQRPRQALNAYQRALNGKLSDQQRSEVLASVAKATIALQSQQQTEVAKATAQQWAEHDRQTRLAAEAQKPTPVYKKAWFWGVLSGVVVSGVALGVGLGLGLRAEPAMNPMPNPEDVIPVM